MTMMTETADADEVKFYTSGAVAVKIAKGNDSDGQVLPGVTTTRTVFIKNEGDAASVEVTFTAAKALVDAGAVTLHVTGAENGSAWTITNDGHIYTCTFPGLMEAGAEHSLVVSMSMKPNIDCVDGKLCWENEDRTLTPIHGYNSKQDSLLTVRAQASGVPS